MVVSTEKYEEDRDANELPDYLKPKKKPPGRSRSRQRSRSRRKSRDRGKRKKKRSRSNVRGLDRSRSHSHTATGQYIRATGCSSTVKWWEKKREPSSSPSSSRRSSRSCSRQKGGGRDREKTEKPKKEKAEPTAPTGWARKPRQVAIRGCWAQFVLSGQTYYYNIGTAQTQWERPSDLDSAASGAKAAAMRKSSVKLVGTTGSTSMLL